MPHPERLLTGPFWSETGVGAAAPLPGTGGGVMYRCIDAVVVRAAARPPVGAPAWPDLTGDSPEQVAGWRHWLEQVWADEVFAAGVEVASPVLARRVREICEGRELHAADVRRATLALVRYWQRANHRATPFGLFAGVLPAQVSATPQAWFGEGQDHRATARVDGEWLDRLISRLETIPQLWPHLLVLANNLAFVRDTRLVIGCQRQHPASPSGGPVETAVRNTSAVQSVMDAAEAPVRLGDLADKVAAAYPDQSADAVRQLLAGLVEQRMLITHLRAPMTRADPLDHLADAVEALLPDGENNVAFASVARMLRTLRADLARHRTVALPQTAVLRERALRTMLDTQPGGGPVGVDLRLDGSVVLPHTVQREVERAATALVRLAPHPFGTPAWQDYHRRFCERYGLGAAVPLRELLDDDSGLGYPAGYRDSRLDPPASGGLSARDRTLLGLAQGAAFGHSVEVVVDDRMIADLAVADAGRVRVQPHGELRCRLHARSAQALSRGEFTLAVTGASRAAGTTAGRFLDLFDADDQRRMTDAYRRLPTLGEDALLVQVSGPVLSARAENIARNPRVLRHLIAVAEHRSDQGLEEDGLIQLRDLAVCADAERLFLVSLSRRRLVEPVVFSAVEMTHHAHPLIRFLCEVTTARATPCALFSWGAAETLPFLPRLRYGRSILAPVMWALTAADLPPRQAPWSEWADSVARWREERRVPAEVFVGNDDRRTRLDLDEQAHLAVLRAEVGRTERLTVREAPPQDALGWIGGRAHDIVIPLAVDADQRRTSAVPRSVNWQHPIRRDDGHVPGSGEWLYVKLYGHQQRQTTLLTRHLPQLLAAWPDMPWWFLRYRDPDPHLRLRLWVPDTDAFAAVAVAVATWTTQLRHLGLVADVCWDTYRPETGRFGVHAAMTAAEAVFAADSIAAVAQLDAANQRGGPNVQVLAAASMVDLAVRMAGGTQSGLRWLLGHLPTGSALALPRTLLRQAVALTSPDSGTALHALPGGAEIAESWARRGTVLDRYRALLDGAGLHHDAVLADLLHLHHARMIGVVPDSEQLCRRLARAAALSWTTRRREPSS